jgi:hypothetical protein
MYHFFGGFKFNPSHKNSKFFWICLQRQIVSLWSKGEQFSFHFNFEFFMVLLDLDHIPGWNF